MKTIFLDFDGVGHSTLPKHMDERFIQFHLLTECLKSHKRKCEVVISSSWRHTHSIQEIVQLLPSGLGELVVNVTGPAFIGAYARFMEISRYVKEYGVTDWIALDDSKFEFPKNCPQLIACDPRTGLQSAQVELIEKWLKS